MSNLNSEEAIRQAVAARVAEEQTGNPAGSGYSSEPGTLPALTHDYIEQCINHNELGDGIVFSIIHRRRHVYVGQAEQWMYFDNHHWQFDNIGKAHFARADVEDVAELYQKTAAHLTKEAQRMRELEDKNEANRLDTRAKKLRDRIFKLRSESGRTKCVGCAVTNRVLSIAIDGDEIDRNPWVLPVENGVLDLRTGLLMEGRPEDFYMRCSPVRWEGIDAPCPEWEKFLIEIMDGDQDVVDFLQRVFGYGITGLSTEQKFIMLFGKGRNGKGVMTEVIQEILGGTDSFGGLAAPIQSEMLLDQGKSRSSSGPSPDIMLLRGLRIAFASETDEGQRFSAARVKWLSGADTLTGRYPYSKQNIAFSPTHLLCLLTNSKPHAPATDFAFWERLMLVEFPLSFVDRAPQAINERRVDKGLKERLRKELPGILAWLVRGCLKWQELGGLEPPVKVRDAVDAYRKDEDMMADFVEACCVVHPEDPKAHRTVARELYDVFSWWFKKEISQKKNFSQKAFGKLMKEKFERDRVGGNYWYYGVTISEDAKEAMREESSS